MASEADDPWAIAWALDVQAVATGVQGNPGDALPLFDRALTVIQANPALTDLQLLLQINKAVTLGNLDRYEDAFTIARQALHLAVQVGSAIRLVQAHSALGQLLFRTGRWDDALAEVDALPGELKEPTAACCDLGIAAVICFHRGEILEARHHLAGIAPHAKRMGDRLIGPVALARSLDREHTGDLTQALAALTAGFTEDMKKHEDTEDLLADAVRLATQTGEFGTADALTNRAAALASGSQIPHRQANALYCRGLLDHDAALLLTAAEHYGAASWPLLHAKALEAAAGELIRTGNRKQAQAITSRAVNIYDSLCATIDAARLRNRP